MKMKGIKEIELLNHGDKVAVVFRKILNNIY